MRWYLNDASLQEQFSDRGGFEKVLRGLIDARIKTLAIRQSMRLTRSLRDAKVAPNTTVRSALFELRDKDLRAATLSWLDKTGPFVDDDRVEELDDYFTYRDLEVTETGLGEAARRTKLGFDCATFSFVGGTIDFAISPLEVDHGLPEERYGRYPVVNVWKLNALVDRAQAVEPPVDSWRALVQTARRRYPNLEIGELETNSALAREPFEASLRDRSLDLLGVLNEYVANRNEHGVESPIAQEIVSNYFKGDRARFSGESPSNQRLFSSEMIFKRVSGERYFAHWHGKISHRAFRLHIEWPLAKDRKKLEIFYLGPKITKS